MIIGAFVPRLGKRLVGSPRVAFSVLLLHYVCVLPAAVVHDETDASYLMHVASALPVEFFLAMTTYLIGQIMIWNAMNTFAKKNSLKESE